LTILKLLMYYALISVYKEKSNIFLCECDYKLFSKLNFLGIYPQKLGFENLTVIDGDKVELSNLNRQNYTRKDIGRFKVNHKSRKLRELHQNFDGFELHLAKHILKELEQKELAPDYLKEIIKKYSEIKNEVESPPQLSVGSWTVASMCARLMYNFCVGKDVNTFPEVYFQAIE